MNYLQVAEEAARKAGSIHLKYFDSELKIGTKKGESHNRITIADLEAEKAIVRIIKRDYPKHNILAEEKKYQKTGSGFRWVIDPLDGTNNFSHGFPFFAVSIALAGNDDILCGAVYVPFLDEMFAAEKGKGAFLNSKRISVSRTENWHDTLLTTGFYYDRGKDMIENLEKIKRFFQSGILGIRRTGSAAFDLCNVACGRLDGYWEFLLNPWDFAAGKLIVEEANGKVTDRKGNPLLLEKSYIVASNGKIHEKMLDILK